MGLNIIKAIYGQVVNVSKNDLLLIVSISSYSENCPCWENKISTAIEFCKRNLFTWAHCLQVVKKYLNVCFVKERTTRKMVEELGGYGVINIVCAGDMVERKMAR